MMLIAGPSTEGNMDVERLYSINGFMALEKPGSWQL
jgi:hypothetical protein